jgi:hypothetical protein
MSHGLIRCRRVARRDPQLPHRNLRCMALGKRGCEILTAASIQAWLSSPLSLSRAAGLLCPLSRLPVPGPWRGRVRIPMPWPHQSHGHSQSGLLKVYAFRFGVCLSVGTGCCSLFASIQVTPLGEIPKEKVWLYLIGLLAVCRRFCGLGNFQPKIVFMFSVCLQAWSPESIPAVATPPLPRLARLGRSKAVLNYKCEFHLLSPGNSIQGFVKPVRQWPSSLGQVSPPSCLSWRSDSCSST